jgi:hypothetical protein
MKSKAILIPILLVFLIPQPVSAYLDPGFGSMVWQMIAAIAFGAAFTARVYWQRIKNFFNKSKENKTRE